MAVMNVGIMSRVMLRFHEAEQWSDALAVVWGGGKPMRKLMDVSCLESLGWKAEGGYLRMVPFEDK